MGVRSQEPAQGAKFVEQCSRDVQCIVARYSTADENRNQLSFRQRVSTHFEQFFSRPFFHGPVPNTHVADILASAV